MLQDIWADFGRDLGLIEIPGGGQDFPDATGLHRISGRSSLRTPAGRPVEGNPALGKTTMVTASRISRYLCQVGKMLQLSAPMRKCHSLSWP